MNCVFCEIIEGKLPADKLFENEKCLIMLDIDWVIKGHSLVIWKKHVKDISDLSEKEYTEFSKLVYRTETALRRTLKAKKFIIFKSGIMVNHFHFHIYPVDENIKFEEMQGMIAKKTKVKYTKAGKDKFIRDLKLEIGV